MRQHAGYVVVFFFFFFFSSRRRHTRLVSDWSSDVCSSDLYQGVIENKFLNDLAWEINEQSARQCREWADRIANKTGRPRFVAGTVGPLTVSLSNSPDADDAGFRVCTFDQVKAAYINQVRALIAGGSDILLVETIFDSLNSKAALVAIQEVFEQDKKILPIMISAAVGRGGETMISAQTIEAYWNAMKHVNPIEIGRAS